MRNGERIAIILNSNWENSNFDWLDRERRTVQKVVDKSKKELTDRNGK